MALARKWVFSVGRPQRVCDFSPWQTCSLTILDDVQNPSIEGSESFVVFLSSPQGAVLQEPYEANVVIADTFQDSTSTVLLLKFVILNFGIFIFHDLPFCVVAIKFCNRQCGRVSVPSMQFEKSAYTVKELDGDLHLPVVRTGDLSFTSSARCFTRTMSAAVMDDFRERPNVDESRVTFLRGEKVPPARRTRVRLLWWIEKDYTPSTPEQIPFT